MSRFNLIGTGLIIIGIVMMVAKWMFGVEQIGNWTLVPLISGIAINALGRRREGNING